jgi:ABC-2 type transport system permease protein
VIRVFGYLAWRSAYNRTARQLRHLRSPRYVAALLFALVYLWYMVIAQRPAPVASELADAKWVELVGAIALLGAVSWGWIFGVERRVLRFTPAEVTFLFSAPVSRRDLIQFKLLHSQLFILFNALLWTLILSRERLGVSPWLRVISIWVLLTTLSFHRLGASFVRTSLAEHGRLGLRHRVVSLIVLGTVLVGLTWSITDALPAMAEHRGEGTFAFLPALGEAAAQPIPTALTYPFRIMIRPLIADGLGTWAHALWPALIVLLLHYIWVVRSDTAFEEAAVAVSLQRARALSQQGGRGLTAPLSQLRPTPSVIRLAPSGWPAGAILWKNLVGVARRRRVRNVGVALLVGGVMVTLLSFDPEGMLAKVAGWFALTWAGAMAVVGPQWVRNDLRGDLLKLDLLRSYPLRGASVVAAEVIASTVVLTIIQLGLLIIAYLAFVGDEFMEPDLGGRTLLLLAAFVFLPPINLLGMLIQNGTALLYPAWVRLGSGKPAGVEALGQNLLMMVAYLAILSILLALPVLLGGGAFLLLRASLGMWAAIPAAVVILGIMAFEAALLVDWLGGIFERTDSASAGVGA